MRGVHFSFSLQGTACFGIATARFLGLSSSWCSFSGMLHAQTPKPRTRGRKRGRGKAHGGNAHIAGATPNVESACRKESSCILDAASFLHQPLSSGTNQLAQRHLYDLQMDDSIGAHSGYVFVPQTFSLPPPPPLPLLPLPLLPRPPPPLPIVPSFNHAAPSFNHPKLVCEVCRIPRDFTYREVYAWPDRPPDALVTCQCGHEWSVGGRQLHNVRKLLRSRFGIAAPPPIPSRADVQAYRDLAVIRAPPPPPPPPLLPLPLLPRPPPPPPIVPPPPSSLPQPPWIPAGKAAFKVALQQIKDRTSVDEDLRARRKLLLRKGLVKQGLSHVVSFARPEPASNTLKVTKNPAPNACCGPENSF